MRHFVSASAYKQQKGLLQEARKLRATALVYVSGIATSAPSTAYAVPLPRVARGRLGLWCLSFPRQSGGAVNVIRASASFGFDLRDVFPYDLLPDQLRPMGLLLGQVSKWRAQRADRGVRATASF